MGDYVVFTPLILKTRNLKITVKNARRKFEISMPAAMPCKTSLCRSSRDESMRIRMEGAPHKNHEDHTAGKGMKSLSLYILVHKFILMPQAIKIPDAKAAVEK